MAAHHSPMQGSTSPVLQELERLSRSLYRAHPSRRATSLVVPRANAPTSPTADGAHLFTSAAYPDHNNRSSRRLSLSPWRSRPRQELDETEDDNVNEKQSAGHGEKKGIWKWKPMRALAHMAKHRLVCLFSVEVVAVQHLPASMNGVRLAVVVRKKETKDGAVQTMPSRVIDGEAEFEEPLYMRCHLYCSGGAGTGKPIKFEPRPFLVYAVAVDAPQLDFGRSLVDLSLLVKESIQRNFEGQRIRQWDMSFKLAGMAKGGEMVFRLAFQIMDDGGIGIYRQAEVERAGKAKGGRFSSQAKHSRSSLTVVTPTVVRVDESPVVWKRGSERYSRGVDGFGYENVGDTDSNTVKRDSERYSRGRDVFGFEKVGDSELKDSSVEKTKARSMEEDFEFPEFEVIDKGVEIEDVRSEAEASEDTTEGNASVSSEVVKEIVQDRAHRWKLKELQVIARELKALDLVMASDDFVPNKLDKHGEIQRLDSDEETVTREFLQMLETEDDLLSPSKFGAKMEQIDWKVKTILPCLDKNLGSVEQTKDGGFFIAMNPFNEPVDKKEAPKITMQISRAFILKDQKLATGFEVFQRFAAVGSEELGSKLISLAAMDELKDKTAGQIAFEGIAAAVINGRTTEGASSCAARSIMLAKRMSAAMSAGRKERLLTGIWNAKKDPVSVDEILMFSLQRIEAMAIEALKIQADMAEDQTTFDVFPLVDKENTKNPLDSVILPEDWERNCGTDSRVTMLIVVLLRDPARSYEAVGAPIVACIQAIRADSGQAEDENRFKLVSLHVGGFKLQSAGKRTVWDGEKQRLTAVQWLGANEVVRGAKSKQEQPRKGSQEYLWSISSRVMADMWLKPMRNPNVKFLAVSSS